MAKSRHASVIVHCQLRGESPLLWELFAGEPAGQGIQQPSSDNAQRGCGDRRWSGLVFYGVGSVCETETGPASPSLSRKMLDLEKANKAELQANHEEATIFPTRECPVCWAQLDGSPIIRAWTPLGRLSKTE